MEINIPLEIKIPMLWGTESFKKDNWSSINLIVGSNGTGKSLLANEIKTKLPGNIKVRLLSAERLSGFEKQNYSYFGNSSFYSGIDISSLNEIKNHGEDYGLSTSAFIVLKERLDIRIKIEALLSDLFNKTIRLVEEGGFLKPKIQNNTGGDEYGLKESECHGLKEILTLLTFLYDDSIKCLILDEPELHLHPQFQSFFLNEIRKFAGDPSIDPSKKIFFIITHSPYFLDLRDINDLKNILVCHYNTPPNYIESLDPQDEYILKKFLPRFNTHHKQFFFSPNPVFVEGYTDQQVITLLFDRLGYNIGASGSSVIDVGGKDELAVFFRLCTSLKIQARIIGDLDALFRGKLREVGQGDQRCNKFLQDLGLGTAMSPLIGDLEKILIEISHLLIKVSSTDPDINHLIDYLKPIISESDKRNNVIECMMLGIIRFSDKINSIVATEERSKITFVLARFNVLLEALKAANIFIFPKGEIEHYYTQTEIDYLNFSDKQKNSSFHTERDYILISDEKKLQKDYEELLILLKESVPQVKVDIDKHVKFQLIEWIQNVQRAISKGDITDENGLKTNAKVDYKLFNQIIELDSLEIKEDKRFKCKIKTQNSLTNNAVEVEFDENTTAHDFEFKNRIL